jgi:hypothetical protein
MTDQGGKPPCVGKARATSWPEDALISVLGSAKFTGSREERMFLARQASRNQTATRKELPVPVAK